MDELERDLRSTLDRLADGAVPSDDLVGRTLARSVQIRRRRRAITATAVVVGLAAVLGVASIANAATHAHVQVSTPPVTEPAATSTTAEPTPTTVAPPPPPKGSPTTLKRPPQTPGTTAVSTPSTVPAACEPPTVMPADNGIYTLLDNGDISAEFYFPFGPARESHYEVFDDGTPGDAYATHVYTPAEFGPHYLDAWTVSAGVQSCTNRLTFDIEPALTTPTTTTTTPGETTTTDTTPGTTSPPETTTIPG